VRLLSSLKVLGGPADKRGCPTPGHPYEQEGEDIIEDRRLVRRREISVSHWCGIRYAVVVPITRDNRELELKVPRLAVAGELCT
jgi:hypothetical protein